MRRFRREESERLRQIVGYWDILCFLEAHVDRYASPQASSWGDRTVSRPSTPALQAVSVFAREPLRSAAGALAGERDGVCERARCVRLIKSDARLCCFSLYYPLLQWMIGLGLKYRLSNAVLRVLSLRGRYSTTLE